MYTMSLVKVTSFRRQTCYLMCLEYHSIIEWGIIEWGIIDWGIIEWGNIGSGIIKWGRSPDSRAP